VVERARLESVCTVTYRGFESLPHRQVQRNSRKKLTSHPTVRTPDSNPKEGLLNSRSELIQGVKRRSPEGVIKALRLKLSIPPSPPSSKKQ
jgi:hypothetical protein